MKKATEIKYPNSACLFQFCRRVLDHKFGGIRVIDQDVGQILGFDPADCSHWKKGKKNIRSIQAMKSIAEHLGVDERLVVDVASGEIDDSEGFYEYNGYGAFEVDARVLESAKKEFYKRHATSWTKEKEQDFRLHFSINEVAIEKIVNEIIAKVNFTEAPLYLPELVASYPNLKLHATGAPESAVGQSHQTDTTSAANMRTTWTDAGMEIHYPAGTEMRPYMRYRLAKALGEFFLKSISPSVSEFGEFAHHLADVQQNLFAAKLLAPAALIRKEMQQVNVAKDVVSQLSETFWVSKTFMNRRLRDLLQSNQTM